MRGGSREGAVDLEGLVQHGRKRMHHEGEDGEIIWQPGILYGGDRTDRTRAHRCGWVRTIMAARERVGAVGAVVRCANADTCGRTAD